jgi:L-methionine (R)-S-oxide reductase
MTKTNLEVALQNIQNLIENQPENPVQGVMDWMHKNLPGYNWVGIYIMQHHTKTLHLGPFAGAPTDHTVIPFGKGICGQVALSGATHITGDVTAEDNYIACSIETKSEIVVPMYLNDQLIAQIDIDSHTADNFNALDEQLLTQVNAWLTPFVAKLG